MQSRIRNISSTVLIAIFAAACLVPGLMLLKFDGETRSLTENRELAGLPSVPGNLLDLAGWTGQFENFVADHFGSREKLVAAYNFLHVFAGISPIERALVGKNGWLFLEQTFLKDANRGALPLGEAERERLIASFERRRDYLDSKGIAFMVMPVPDKNSMFPEYLPDSVEFVGPSRLEQFLQAAQGARFDHVDVSSRLREAKAGGEEIYFQTDSHWNSRGAWFAYLALMESLQAAEYEGGRTLSESEVEFIRLDPYHPTDIVKNLLGLSGWIREDHGIRARVEDPAEIRAFRTSDGMEYDYLYGPPPGKEHKHFKRSEKRDGSRVLIYRDSYGNAMLPFLIHSFDELIYARAPKNMSFDPADIERYQPDLVIYEFVERALFHPPDDQLLKTAKEVEQIAPGTNGSPEN